MCLFEYFSWTKDEMIPILSCADIWRMLTDQEVVKIKLSQLSVGVLARRFSNHKSYFRNLLYSMLEAYSYVDHTNNTPFQ